MKTSIFYPNTSLPVFLHGPTGSGKSFMARKIYEFAVQEGILKPDAPFIIMNCAQYVNNIELLSSNLFGYVKELLLELMQQPRDCWRQQTVECYF